MHDCQAKDPSKHMSFPLVLVVSATKSPFKHVWVGHNWMSADSFGFINMHKITLTTQSQYGAGCHSGFIFMPLILLWRLASRFGLELPLKMNVLSCLSTTEDSCYITTIWLVFSPARANVWVATKSVQRYWIGKLKRISFALITG